MADATLDETVDAFLHHVLLERGLSRNTVDAYSRDLARFVATATSGHPRTVRSLERADVRGFLAVLEEAGLGARSRARALVAVRRFLKFAEQEELLDHDPLEGIDAPRLPRALPKTLSPDERVKR